MISIFFLLIFIILLTLNLLSILNIKTNYIISLLISFFIISFTADLSNSLKAVLDGATLWFDSILPTVFPFAFLCNLLISYDGIYLFSIVLGPIICKPLGLSKNCSFPIAASFLCGYPLGAKYSSYIYNMNYIKKDEYERLLNIASNCSPIFILGAVSISMLNNTFYGYILLIANYLSIIIIGLLTKNKKPVNGNPVKIFSSPKSFGEVLTTSLEGSLKTTITIGAFIVIFSVLISIIKSNALIGIVIHNLELYLNLTKNTLYSLFLGLIEITNGCKLISTSNINIHLKLSIISFLCSFSGLSIITQVSSFTVSSKVSIIRYSLFKALQGLISFFITYLLSSLFLKSIEASSSFFHPRTSSSPLIVIPVLLLIVLYIITKLIHKFLLNVS